MGVTERCPRHGYPFDDCPVCERQFEDEQFDRGENWPPEFPHPDQERFERWLGEIAP